MCPQKRFKKVLRKLRMEEEMLDTTVTLFSVPVRNSSLAVSRNSRIGLSCVTPWIRSSLCSSNRADKVFPSSVLPGGRGSERHTGEASQFEENDSMVCQERSNRIVK